MIAPVVVRWRRRKRAEERIRFPGGPAIMVTIKSAAVFKVTEIVPSRRNCRKTCPRPPFTNWGIKERKTKRSSD